MKHEKKNIKNTEVELTITVEPKEYEEDLKEAANRLSERAAVKGFRPGKAPYESIKQQLGEVKILEEALESIIQKTFFEIIKEEKLDTVGMPKITVEKMVPGNDIIYKAEIALLPKVKLVDLKKIKVENKKVEVTEEEMEKVLTDLKKMQMQEKIKEGESTKEDKVLIDMDMFIGGVAVEGGQAKNHHVYLNEEHYIPGLKDQLIGVKKDDTKEFSLRFPKNHYQKHLADKDVDFKIKVNEVFELILPELNDEFAKKLGQESAEKLKELLKDNMMKEAEMKENQRLEANILEQMIDKSEFGEIPQILIDSEKRKMFYELKHDLEHHGIEMEQYLKDIKKTEEQIFKDFEEQANKRVKAALISRQIAVDNNIKVEKEDLDKEMELIKKTYAHDEKVLENLKRPDVLESIIGTIQNRKVIEFLKTEIIK
ncbi:MAG TPA: trigger factor [Candidatus Magasanikbacteria bacterium]|nr:trigger factor [Candidatus Magasanikbacteria bacterium]